MAIVDFLAQALFELPAAGIAWVLQHATGMRQQTAEQVADFLIVGILTAACFMAWCLSQPA
jgi:hypothetical protein